MNKPFGPEAQHVKQWSSYRGDAIVFDFRVMSPMSDSDREFLIGVIDLMKRQIGGPVHD